MAVICSVNFSPRTYKGGGWMPPPGVFENFEKRISSAMLKLSVAVHLSFPDTLM